MPYHIAPDIIIDATLYTLLAFSLITWTLIFFKSWQFAKNSSYNKQYNTAFWDATDLKTARTVSRRQSQRAEGADCYLRF